ncbi:MAG: hypothetical protein FD167_1105 [bacterium]|nr:MAG: hypothetical protein FD167_1105 [bacterium]
MQLNKLNIGLLSGFPFIFFITHLLNRTSQERSFEILWLCHISNLTLFIALLLNNARLIRMSAIWLIIGTIFWAIDLIVFKDISISSTIAHIGGVTVALLAINRVKMTKYNWVDASLFGLFIQQLCRFITPVKFNINVAHSIYPGMDKIFLSTGITGSLILLL